MKYRFEAQVFAQNNKFDKAEQKVLSFLSQNNISNLNKHIAYNDLILYTYKQIKSNHNEAIDRCLFYCLEHIKIIPKLIEEFKKYGYNFEEEFIISIDIAIIIYKYKNNLEGALDLCNVVIGYYKESSSKQDYIANISYDIIQNPDKQQASLIEIENIFYIFNKLANQQKIEAEKQKVVTSEKEDFIEDNSDDKENLFRKVGKLFKRK